MEIFNGDTILEADENNDMRELYVTYPKKSPIEPLEVILLCMGFISPITSVREGIRGVKGGVIFPPLPNSLGQSGGKFVRFFVIHCDY